MIGQISLLLCVVACACAHPLITSQYHAQDELGQYSYGYSGGPSSKHEERSLDGVTRGAFSYIDPNGQVQSRSYIADEGGFRVAASDIPLAVRALPQVQQELSPYADVRQWQPIAVIAGSVAPTYSRWTVASPIVVAGHIEDSVDASALRAKHLQLLAEARARAGAVSSGAYFVDGQLQDTPEVSAAKANHLAAVEEAKQRDAALSGESAAAIPIRIQDSQDVISAGHIGVVPATRYVAQYAPAPVANIEYVNKVSHMAPIVVAEPHQLVSHSEPQVVSHAAVVPLAEAAAAHQVIATPQVIAAPQVEIRTQHHAQDEAGQYTYGYSNGQSAKTETKTIDGVVRGSFSYVDPNGLVQSRSYIADDVHGFRVAASDLPQAPPAVVAHSSALIH